MKRILIAIFLSFYSLSVWASICNDAAPQQTYDDYSTVDESSTYLMDYYRGWLAFDDDPYTEMLSGAFVDHFWVRFLFDLPELVEQYTVQINNSMATYRAPKDWELQAHDGAQWVVLDSRQGETGWHPLEKRSYVVSNPGTYDRYRLYVFDDNHSGSGSDIHILAMSEIELKTCNCSTPQRKVPYLTDDTARLTASSAYPYYPAWYAFDSYANTLWLSDLFPGITTVEYDFQQPTDIHEYTLTYANGSITSRAPKSFELQGWNGYKWLQLDYRDNQQAWAGFEQRTYAVTNPGSYSKYRLYFTEDNDDRDSIVMLSLGDIELMGCAD